MGLTPTDVRKFAYDLALAYVKNGVTIPESQSENKMAGKDWFTVFIKRHIELSIGKPEATRAGEYLVLIDTMLEVFSKTQSMCYTNIIFVLLTYTIWMKVDCQLLMYQ